MIRVIRMLAQAPLSLANLQMKSRTGGARTALLQFASIGWSEFPDHCADVIDGWVFDLGGWMRDQDKGKRSAPRWNFWGGQSSAVDRELEGHHSWDHAVAFFKEFLSAIVSQLDPARNRSGDFNPLKFTWVCNWGKHRSRKIATYIRTWAQEQSFSDPLPSPCRLKNSLRIT